MHSGARNILELRQRPERENQYASRKLLVGIVIIKARAGKLNTPVECGKLEAGLIRDHCLLLCGLDREYSRKKSEAAGA